MKIENKGNYWICIIGPAEHALLPDGADFPLRQAVKKSFEETTGHNDFMCWSGWGNDEKEVERILNIKISEDEKTNI